MSGPSGQKRTYGAAGRGDLLMFEPEVLQVITDPKHPQYDPRVELPVDEALVLSIMELGVITPLAISRDGEDVYVTDGRRRHKAAIEANKRLKKLGRPLVQVPCVWKRGDDTRLFEISIAANELRKGDGAVERAKKMQRLVEAGRSEEQIALTFGVTAKTVKSALALLECAKPVQLAVESGALPATAATKLAELPRAEQVEALNEMVAKGATKGRSAEKAVQAKKEQRGIQVVARMRSRVHLERLQRELLVDLNESSAALVAWMLGDDHALDRFPRLLDAAIRADAKAGKKSSAKNGNGAEKGKGNPTGETVQA